MRNRVRSLGVLVFCHVLARTNWGEHMAEEMQDLSVGDMEAVAGGKVRITTPTHTDRMDTKKLYTLTWHAMNNFKSIDSVLEQCKTEQERKFVYKTWDQLTGGGPVYRGQDREHMPRVDL